jgi:hypothetical protein
MLTRRIGWLLVCLILLAGCRVAAEPAATATRMPSAPAPTVAPSAEPTPGGHLAVIIYYPKEDSKLETGQSIKFTLQVVDAQGNALNDAQVLIAVRDPGGTTVATIPAVAGSGKVYRTDYWAIPHGRPEGTWSVAIEARTDYARGDGSGSFKVENSTSDILLSKYGFWLDAPTLGGITPSIYAEKGDAQNGMIRWGGFIPQMHVLPANWVDVQWREGDFKLENPEAVRRFMLEELGDLGFTPVRSLDVFEPIQFKQWNAWRVRGQGQFKRDQMEWVIFYAPEVNKTYALGTTVVLPPTGIDPHARLRDSFAVFPDVHASGVAPEPLPRLLPGPELVSPPLAARFEGLDAPIVLQWKPVKDLAEDEYYEVVVDYNYREDNPAVKFTTRQTQVTLPETLYRTPNCHVFNWQVTLKRQTGIYADGKPKGEPISYNSLYRYLQWFYPPGEEEPFTALCPNAQF